MTKSALSIPKRPCKCTAGSKPGKPAQCCFPTNHHSGYCKSCRDQCCSLQRHNRDHSKPEKKRESYRAKTDRLMLDHLEALRVKMIGEMRFDDAMLLRDVKTRLEKVQTQGKTHED